jgi:hypothetical protein
MVVVSKLFEEWSREAASRCMHHLWSQLGSAEHAEHNQAGYGSWLGVAWSRDTVVHATPSYKFLHKVQEQELVQAFKEDVHAEHRVKDECNLDGNQWRNRACCLAISRRPKGWNTTCQSDTVDNRELPRLIQVGTRSWLRGSVWHNDQQYVRGL